MKKHFTQTVLENEQIAYNTFRLVVDCDAEVLKWFRPGQFAHIAIPHAGELLLRRPISINYVDYEGLKVHIVYHIAGKGTDLLSFVQAGEMLDILMPMGNGFPVTDAMQKIWLIGGGVGVAPLKSFMGKFPDRKYKAFLGFRSKEYVYQEDDFRSFADTFVTTDDGSYCQQGFCTELLKKQLNVDRPDVIFACGPLPFFKALAKVTGDAKVYVSMEQRMGCGTGGCATCVCGINGENKRVCVEGPVFDMKEVDALYG